jgi:hypothetical protein
MKLPGDMGVSTPIGNGRRSDGTSRRGRDTKRSEKGMPMTKKLLAAAAALTLLPLGACGHKTDAADNVQAAADNSADAMDANASAIRDEGSNIASDDKAVTDNAADALNNKADAVRDAGENKADAIDKSAKK